MRERYDRKAVLTGLPAHGPQAGQPFCALPHICPSPPLSYPPQLRAQGIPGATWPRPFGKHRATGTSFLCPGTLWQPEAMHCNAGLQDFLQGPRVGRVFVKTLPQSPVLAGQAQAQEAAEGVFVQSKWGRGERALQEVDVLCVLGHGALEPCQPAPGSGYGAPPSILCNEWVLSWALTWRWAASS